MRVFRALIVGLVACVAVLPAQTRPRKHVLAWADVHHAAAGSWPIGITGLVAGAPRPDLEPGRFRSQVVGVSEAVERVEQAADLRKGKLGERSVRLCRPAERSGGSGMAYARETSIRSCTII